VNSPPGGERGRRAADLYIFAEASVMGPATQGIYTMPDSEVTDLSGLVGKTIARYPRTLAAFYAAIEEGQQIADTNRSDVEEAMMDIPAPFGVSRQTAAVLALDSYPFSSGPVGSVNKIRLERVVNVMQQFIGFPKFNIDTMLMPRT
jgi:ABC-type nitrate/sulfonate/bicarbonate transport system substrate-binding protein